MSTPRKENPNLIGLFDSGVGGLSILKQLVEVSSGIPEAGYQFIYLGDNARCPYGDRTSAEISSYVQQIMSWLVDRGVKRIVMACNTSAAVSSELARQAVNLPVHDLISATAPYAAGRFNKIGVVATSTTCRSQAFSKAIKALNAKAQVIEIPCPDLVPLVENGLLDGQEAISAVSKYTTVLNEAGVDALIFGCTHFPFLSKVFRSLMHDHVVFIDPAFHLNQEIFGKTQTTSLETKNSRPSYEGNSYYTTGNPEAFARAAEQCLLLPQGQLQNCVFQLPLHELTKLEDLSLPLSAASAVHS